MILQDSDIDLPQWTYQHLKLFGDTFRAIRPETRKGCERLNGILVYCNGKQSVCGQTDG